MNESKHMKKLIAMTALVGLVAVGCASRHGNEGGASDQSGGYSSGRAIAPGQNNAMPNTDPSVAPNSGTSTTPQESAPANPNSDQAAPPQSQPDEATPNQNQDQNQPDETTPSPSTPQDDENSSEPNLDQGTPHRVQAARPI